MNKNIFFLDIDGTLLNYEYLPTEPRLKDVIKHYQSDGQLFAINSNRSLEDLLPIAEMFGITGPLVGENGCFIYDVRTKVSTILLSIEEIESLQLYKKVVQNISTEFLKSSFPSDEVIWMTTDTVELITKNDPKGFKDGTLLLLNNKYRKYTQSIHLRRIQNSIYTMLPKILEDLVGTLKNQLDSNIVTVTSSGVFNNVLVYPSVISKRKGVEHIMELFPEYRIVVIGDEKNDYQMVEGIGDFYSVANADDETKKLAKYCTSQSYTKGVYDILQKIR